MIHSLTIGIGSIVTLMLGWIIIQSVWRRMFKDEITDDDVLAGRSNCGNCGCGLICKKKRIIKT
ncbi:MAG: hypothetical protein AAF363_12205 [Bacteroidota bacterium]